MQYKRRRKHLSRTVSRTFSLKKCKGLKMGMDDCLLDGSVIRSPWNQSNEKLNNNRMVSKYW